MFFGVRPLIYRISYFSRNRFFSLSAYEVTEGTDMLTKRSTPVDQNLESESMDSKLSVAIFAASRTHLRTQECCVYQKKVEKLLNPWKGVPLVSSLRDIAQSTKVNKRFSCIYRFSAVFLLLPSFLSPQMSSGGYKYSYRKLRVCTLRCEILVNGCWPFGQHFSCLVDHVSVNNVCGQLWKSEFSYIWYGVDPYTCY